MQHSQFVQLPYQHVDIFGTEQQPPQPPHLQPQNPPAATPGGRPPRAWPHPRSGHRLLAGEHDLWLVGGFHPAENDAGGLLFEEVWQYNIASGQWRRLETKGAMPPELASHAALLDPPYLLVHGGTATPFGIRRSRRLHRLCLNTLEWSEVATTDTERRGRPKKVYGHSFTLVTGPDESRTIYQFGGTTGHEYSNAVHSLDTRTWQWHLLLDPVGAAPAPELAPAADEAAAEPIGGPPSPRYRHETVHWRGRLYIVGGGTATSVCRLDRLAAFCPATRTWSWMRTRPAGPTDGLPQARRCHACLLHGDWLMLSGGCTEDNSPLGDVWYLYMPTGAWHRARHSLPRPTYFHAAAATPDGRAFVFGGVVADTMAGRATSRSDALYSCWLPGPPCRLDRMCLRLAVPRLVSWLRRRGLTVTSGRGGGGGSLRLKLRQLGVPPELVLECLAGWRGGFASRAQILGGGGGAAAGPSPPA